MRQPNEPNLYEGITRGPWKGRWLFCGTCEEWLPLRMVLKQSWKCRKCGTRPTITSEGDPEWKVRQALVDAKVRIEKLEKEVLRLGSTAPYPSSLYD